MFCEALADFRLASGLVDRVLRDSGAAWVADHFETPEAIRTWHAAPDGRPYYDLHGLNQHTDPLHIRTRGHFNGQPGRPGAAMARKAFLLALDLHRKAPEPLDAVVLIWDVDHQQRSRPQGVEDARQEARSWAPFAILCGFPDPEAEAWVLAGFEPCDEEEQKSLADLQRELGFSPILEAARLRDRQAGALRNIKRVVTALSGGDLDRIARCWIEPSLEDLRLRGRDTGLTAFLAELKSTVHRLLDPAAARRSSR